MRRVRGQRRSGDVLGGKSANFNRRKTKAKLGDHLIQCDISGQVCLRSEARFTWDGLLVSNQNWDVKHPQLTINVPPEDISVRDARPFKGSFPEAEPEAPLFPTDGNYYFKLGEDRTPMKFEYRGSAQGILDTDIPINIGDTVTFTYDANDNDPSTGQNFIVSQDNVNFFGWLTTGRATFVGYTATVNGVPVNNGDFMPIATSDYYPANGVVGGCRLPTTVVLTATVSTDVERIGDSLVMPLYNVIIQTPGQTWIYTIDSGTFTNEDLNGSGNDLNLTSSNSWINNPVMFNTGSDAPGIFPYVYLDNFAVTPQDKKAPKFAQPSLRVDETGKSFSPDEAPNYMSTNIESIPIPYGAGFTIEAIALFTSAVIRRGQTCNIVASTDTTPEPSLWAMGFDDYDGSANGSGVIKPKFNLLKRNEFYYGSSDYVNNVANIEGNDEAVSGNTYHLLATVRPSNNTVEFWINGDSAGEVQLSQAEFDAWAIPNGAGGSEDILNGNFKTIFEIGPRVVDGLRLDPQNSNIQDLKIHLLEATDAFAKVQATTANYTI